MEAIQKRGKGEGDEPLAVEVAVTSLRIQKSKPYILFCLALQPELGGTTTMVAHVSDQRSGRKLLFSTLLHPLFCSLIPPKEVATKMKYSRMTRASGNPVLPCQLPLDIFDTCEGIILLEDSPPQAGKILGRFRIFSNSGTKYTGEAPDSLMGADCVEFQPVPFV